MKVLVDIHDATDVNRLCAMLMSIDNCYIHHVNRKEPHCYTPMLAYRTGLRHVNRAIVFDVCSKHSNIVVVCKGSNVESMYWYFDKIISTHQSIENKNGDALVHKDDNLISRAMLSEHPDFHQMNAIKKRVCSYL